MALSCSKKLPALLRGITSKHHGHFYHLNCLHSLAKEKILELHKNVCDRKKKDFYKIIMPFEDTKSLEFNQYQSTIYLFM